MRDEKDTSKEKIDSSDVDSSDVDSDLDSDIDTEGLIEIINDEVDASEENTIERGLAEVMVKVESDENEAETEEADENEAETEEADENELLTAEVEKLKDEHDHLRELYLRKLAEFENFRKRTDRERAELEKLAGEGIVRELIPVLDNFERALQHSGEDDQGAFKQGVEMIAKQLWDVLERQGLEMVDPIGQPFEPEFHEAVQRVDDSGEEPGTIVYVLAKGYLFGGKLVRPAMVGVAADKIDPDDGSDVAEVEDEEQVEAS